MEHDKHAGAFVGVEAPTATTATPAAAKAPKSVDNEDQADHAERERTFATGDDAPATPPAALLTQASWVGTVTARILQAERPSPFGLAGFPPIPGPRDRGSGR